MLRMIGCLASCRAAGGACDTRAGGASDIPAEDGTGHPSAAAWSSTRRASSYEEGWQARSRAPAATHRPEHRAGTLLPFTRRLLGDCSYCRHPFAQIMQLPPEGSSAEPIPL